MLKKAGILVAATAAGLLAMSPLAFAGDKGHEGDRDETSYHYEGGDVDIDDDSLVDIDDSSVNECDNMPGTNDESRNGGGLLLGALGILNSSSVNALQCTNILNNVLTENDIIDDISVDVL